MSVRPLRSQRPRRIAVAEGARGQPVRVAEHQVLAIREEWRVEEGWWSQTPTRRRYFEVVLDDGRLCVIYEDRSSHAWWRHGG